MFASQGKNGGIYYNVVRQEPDMHPLIELGISTAPYAAGLGLAQYMRNKPFSKDSKYSLFDVSQKVIRNFADATPFSFFNTFRIPEMMSPYLSPQAMGLDTATSLLDPSKQVSSYVASGDYFQSQSSRDVLRSIIGENNYNKISSFMIGGSTNFQFTTEFDPNGTGAGRLIFQEIEEINSGGALQRVAKPGSAIDLGEVRLAAGAYANDVLDLLDDLGKEGKINPFLKGVYQNLDIPNLDYESVFKNSDGDILKYAFVPSVRGAFSSLEDIRARTAVPTAHLSMGIERFNRVLSATFNQIPIIGRPLERLMDTDLPGIGKLSLKTDPGPFYKQFLNIGLKATKLGAVYMGLETTDHYRRNYGMLGQVVASSAIAGVSTFVASKVMEQSDTSLTGSIPKGRLGTIFGAVMGAQLLLPGFDKGVVEGIATTGAAIDVGMSAIGQYTGLSAYRRGIEGLFPGFTDVTTGLFLGLGTAALAYSGYGEEKLKRAADNKISGFDRGLSSIMPDFIRQRVGLMGPGGILHLPLTTRETKASVLMDILDPARNLSGEFNSNFKLYNPLYQQIESLDPNSQLFKDYTAALNEITQGTQAKDLSGSQVKRLQGFFNANKELFENIFVSDGRTIDKGEIYSARLDANYSISQKIDSALYQQRQVNNQLNESLLYRINEINTRYEDSGFFGNILRRTEIFGAEMYHSFFGATLSGELTRTIDGEDVNVPYAKLAGELNAKPILGRLGALVLGVTAVHQVLTSGFFGSMEDPGEKLDYYSGKKLVEIKAGRFWEGGGTPYEGGQTSYFRPSLYASMMSRASEKSVWGDDDERFNPFTKFFLKNFTYYLEDKNYYDRPYPITSAAFKDIPVIGDLLSSTIGRIVKPVKLMHEDEFMRTNEFGETEYAFKEDYGSSLRTGAPMEMPTSPYNTISLLGNLQYQFRELEGLTGFAKQTFQDMTTGQKYLGVNSLLYAESNEMTATTNDFWDMELGGLAFMSEPLRRLLPRKRSEIETYNPIANSMPSYIPDRLKRGDPYRLLPNGYARLPGKGYEALNPEVAGLDPEDYPDIHKYKILADVAPKSRMTMKLREELMERRAAGATTSHENEMFDMISEYHQKRIAATRDFDDSKAIKLPVISDITSSIYSGGETLIRKVAAPAEYAVPGIFGFGFRPASKLLGNTRSAIEIYESERIYGTKNAFWDKPWRDSFRPAMYSAANLMGWDGKPGYVQEREKLNEHFDKINFMKYMNLADSADNIKDKNRYLELAAQTRTGVNPNGDALSIYLSLPNEDKRFFDTFSKAQGSERERILEMVPEDQKNLYRAVWSRIDSGEDLSLYSGSKAQIDTDYMNQKFHELRSYFNENQLPPADWIGWHKDVDIEDVKVKYVQNLGGEIHDYDMWESQMRSMSRKPYLEGSDMFMYESPKANTSNMAARIGTRISRGVLNTSNVSYENSRADIIYNDDRQNEIAFLMSQAQRG